jgi:hypothetical protein
MKKLTFFILLILFFSASCKKEPEPPQILFFPSLSAPDLIAWDSVSYTTINYSYQTELKENEWDNPAVYSHSVNLDLRAEYLTLEANQVIVIKKFDILDKSGKILYYIPFSVATSSAKLKLPWLLHTGEGKANYDIPVMRFRD